MMLRNIVRVTSLGALNYVAKLKVSQNYTKMTFAGIRNYVLSAIGLFGVVHAKKDDYTTQYDSGVKKATEQGEKYLTHLMCMLRMLILQTSIEYQRCLIDQIQVTKHNNRIGPVGEHWDELVGMRIKGNELKDELIKYEALAKNIGDIVHREAKTFFFGNEIVLKELNNELEKLQKLCNEQLQEIHKYETQLLEANRESILQGTD